MSAPNATAWSALENKSFRPFWAAGVLMSSGMVIQDVSASWLMTTLTSSPGLIAAIQTVQSLPILLLAIPAGALADVLDRRRWMIALLLLQFALALTLGTLAFGAALTPLSLLLLLFFVGCLFALFNPAWMRTVPDVLSGPEIPKGVTLNSMAVNLSRLIGGTLAALLLATFFPGAGFWVNGLLLIAPLAVLQRWNAPPPNAALPPEAVSDAIASGLRYAQHSPLVRTVLLRTTCFVIFACAVPTLLPVVAKQILHLDALGFGLLTASFGAGALFGATIAGPLRRFVSQENLMTAATLILALAAWAMAELRNPWLLGAVMACAGAGWVSMVANFAISVGSVAAPWVLSRMLALYMLSFQGGAAIGSLLWGQFAQWTSPASALILASLTIALSSLLRFLRPMPATEPDLLAPSRHWPAPPAVEALDAPAMVSVRYVVRAEQQASFLHEMQQLRLERTRDGATHWYLYRSAEAEDVFLEVFHLRNWQDHLRQHERTTRSAADVQQRIRALHAEDAPPEVRHWITPADESLF